MQRTILMTTALAVVVLASGAPMTPVQAVAADCDADYTITAAEPNARTLTSLDNLVGSIEVDDSGEVEVRVKLDSGDSMSFGVFVVDGTCQAAGSSLSSCDDDVPLESGGTTQEDCVLQPAESDQTIEYFFVYETEEALPIGYKDWILP